MVLASRGWLSISRAARNAHGAYARLLLLAGIVAVAWIAAGMGVAHGDTGAESGGFVENVLGVGETVERTGQAAGEEGRRSGLFDAEASATASTEALAETVVPRISGLPESTLQDSRFSTALEESTVGTVTERTVTDTARTVDGTARETYDLVGGVARTGRTVVETTDETQRVGTLVDNVTEGLSESVGHHRIDSVTDPGGPLGLPILETSDEPALATEKCSDVEEGERSDEEPGQEDPRVDHAPPVHVTEAGLRVATEVAHTAARKSVHEDEGTGRVHLIGGGSHHQAGTDATGASAPSFPAPGAAGFLMHRSGHMVLRAQRVALPGDPTLVVRDAADDPSFSPD